MKLSLVGVEQVKELLNGLPLSVQHRVMLGVHHQAAKPLVEDIRQHTPVSRKSRNLRGKRITPGGLKKSIGSASLGSPKRTGEIGAVMVGARVRSGYRGYHAHLVEFGTKPRNPGGWYAKFRGAHKTVMPKQPFIEPSFNRTKGRVAANMQQAIVDKMYSYLRRQAKTQGVTLPKIR